MDTEKIRKSKIVKHRQMFRTLIYDRFSCGFGKQRCCHVGSANNLKCFVLEMARSQRFAYNKLNVRYTRPIETHKLYSSLIRKAKDDIFIKPFARELIQNFQNFLNSKATTYIYNSQSTPKHINWNFYKHIQIFTSLNSYSNLL